MAPHGVSRLLQDLEKLYHDKDSCDVIFVAGPDEVRLLAHKIVLKARCSSFQNVKRGDICNIQGTTVTSSINQTTNIKWPKAKADVLEQILVYIYCAKIDFHDLDIFEILAISLELGIEDLKVPCIEYFNNNLCFENACTHLAQSLNLDRRIKANSNKKSNPFVEQCTSFVCKYAFECFQTASFLELPKEALIHLVSSDQLAMEEEEVWRAVMRWARHQTKIDDPIPLWNEDQRSSICQALSGVIEHVRILLIDSQVFAEEVEPTGSVPIEMSLERYRFAALPNKFAHSDDQRCQPRILDRFFHETHLLAGSNLQFQRILNEWYGSPKQAWKLIYRASLHGYSASAFHEHCDNHSPTFVIVSGHNGDLCGGFSDVPWATPTNIHGQYLSSERAFLFTLANRKNLPPTKYSIVRSRFAVINHAKSGPCFGGGADLAISDSCDSNVKSYSNFPHSFDGPGASSSLLMGDYNFSVKDYEVFTITSKIR